MEDSTRKHRATVRCRILMSSLERATEFLNNFDEDRDRLEVSPRLEALNDIRRELEEAQFTLEEMETSDEGMAANQERRSFFEGQFFRIKAGLTAKLPPPIIPHDQIHQNTIPRGSYAISGLKLPSIALPEFSGDYKDWRVFFDTFHALIHTNPDLPDIQKFHYLRAAVKGDAAQLIESVDISAADYLSTWEMLVNRYSNEYLMKKKRLQALFELPRMESDTADALHRTVDVFERHVKGLHQMGEPTDAWSTILEHLLCTRLHDDTLRAWEDHASNIKQPTYKDLVDFLHRRNRVLESISVNHQYLPSQSVICSHASTSSFTVRENRITNAANNTGLKCHACDQRHPLLKCFKFSKMSPAERLGVINSKRLCMNCFRGTHFVRDCPGQDCCRVCGKRHHTMIHPGYDEGSSKYATAPRPSRFENSAHASVNVTQCNEDSSESILTAATTINPPHTYDTKPYNKEKQVIMPTAVVKIVDCYGKEHMARAILDCASQASLMTDRMAQLLRLRRSRVSMLVNGIGDKPKLATESVTAQIRSRKKYYSNDIDFIILQKITPKLPCQTFPIDNWKIPRDVFLADPAFNHSSEVDLLISNEHFFSFFTSAARIELHETLPFLVDSVFGWVVSGAINASYSQNNKPSCNVVTVPLSSLETAVEKFWKIEEVPIRSTHSAEEQECEEFFVKTTSRTPTGRYVVKLPRHPNFDVMVGDTEATARRRFDLLERRLSKCPELKNDYDQFMSEYISLGHMKLIEGEDTHVKTAHYLPHHPVFKNDSTTTKTRVVFDASAKTATGFSINEALMVGPVIQDDLISIVLRFRTYPVALVADIEKMYRQILLHNDDTPLQRILWRFDPDQPVQKYELLTVTYGMAPSSFLATRTLKQLAEDEGSAYPKAKPALLEGFYVDDFIGGADTVVDAISLRDELIELLRKGGFSLRKWLSNKPAALKGLTPALKATMPVQRSFETNGMVKALGICWEPDNDILRFDPTTQENDKITKRTILSAISRLFDPLGLISPIVIRGKIIIQQLWLLSCGWDDGVPEPFAERWNKYAQQLQRLSEFRVDRYALLPQAVLQLHTFADASEQAYGCCTYARSVDKNGTIRVNLLASKSRVAPLKRVTLPRLELCAADLAAKLHNCILQALNINISASYFWSDSMVTLQWLKAPPYTWKTFVANKVAEIQNRTQGAHWNHVAGKQNPADLVSRGMDVDDFLVSHQWKHGPEWLALPEFGWPISSIADYPQNGTERRREQLVAVLHSQSSHNIIFDRCSTQSRLLRVVAYCLRFIQNARLRMRVQLNNPLRSFSNHILSVREIAAANNLLIRLAQADNYKEEIRDLKLGKPLSNRSSLRALHPFLDTEGIVRVGGRLRLSEQPYLSKHPAILPSFHPYARMIAKAHHLMLMHGGGRVTLATMRQTYWPINGRRLVRSVLRNCFRCARASPVPASQQIGQLPLSRITASRPFNTTGIDFAGPVYLKPINKRAAATKAYICIFICFCTKAVHIELVSDLSTQAFLCALRRFIARRGKPSDIYSDNGKNFEGAKNELAEMYNAIKTDRHAIEAACTNDYIVWHFSPPKAPNFGGLWEAAVKIAKKQLYRQLGNTRLNFEDITTVLAQIEASMNSRPLVPLTDDPNDLSCLTPAHFLVGTSLYTLPEPSLLQIPLSKLDHYQRLQKLHQEFWHHWRTEYLQELQRDTKPRNPNTDIHPGRLVTIVEDFQVPVRWPLARIVSVHPGKDNLTRVVTLKTSRGIIKRPVTKICLLPTESDATTAATPESNKSSDPAGNTDPATTDVLCTSGTESDHE